MNDIFKIILLTGLAGISIPIGATLTHFYHDQVKSGKGFIHFMNALGGGLILSAVALVLVPDGIKHLSIVSSSIAFVLGTICFCLIDHRLSKASGGIGLLLAMLLDFVPEAIALGASYIENPKLAIFLAIIIGLQNIPEGFNSYLEIKKSTNSKVVIKWLFPLFILLSLFGPLSGYVGYSLFSTSHQSLGLLMIFSAGGILYLIFQDVAPKSTADKEWIPPLGACLGFLIGLIGHQVQQMF